MICAGEKLISRRLSEMAPAACDSCHVTCRVRLISRGSHSKPERERDRARARERARAKERASELSWGVSLDQQSVAAVGAWGSSLSLTFTHSLAHSQTRNLSRTLTWSRLLRSGQAGHFSPSHTPLTHSLSLSLYMYLPPHHPTLSHTHAHLSRSYKQTHTHAYSP